MCSDRVTCRGGDGDVWFVGVIRTLGGEFVLAGQKRMKQAFFPTLAHTVWNMLLLFGNYFNWMRAPPMNTSSGSYNTRVDGATVGAFSNMTFTGRLPLRRNFSGVYNYSSGLSQPAE